MKNLYLVKYSVKGIKTIDEIVSLSFYKKIISNNPDTREYNVKGIYGMNGSGKSGIVTSVDIFRNLIMNAGYLSNPIVQKKLDAIINKKVGELFIEAEYIAKLADGLELFRYTIRLIKESTGKYVIADEELSSKNAASKKNSMETIFKIVNGEIDTVKKSESSDKLDVELKKTINLLSMASMPALFYEKSLMHVLAGKKKQVPVFFASLIILLALGKNLHVYLDVSDDHRDYLIQNSFGHLDDFEDGDSKEDDLLTHFFEMNREQLNTISVSENFIVKASYKHFEKTVGKLYEFLHIFKTDLQGIEIDRKENHDIYVCNLIMVYESYKIHAEFESTGIKKLIRLFTYLREMVGGGIVFIDEFDSNLHDVYLCALLEYLMEYGEGQLCFTTHNVGPMDILKHHKKSIDFLSEDHKIYPWTANGNYSPSKLYKNGMIEGSPFNVDSIDFIGVFHSEKGEY